MSYFEVGALMRAALTLYKITWPCAGTEVFLERLSRLGLAIDRYA